MTRIVGRIGPMGCLTLLVVLVSSLLLACGSSDPGDQALDRLERAIAKLEAAVGTAQSRTGERLSAEALKELSEAGTQVQSAYAEIQTMSNESLSSEQAKRRTALTERAVYVVGDMLNLRLADEKK